MSALRAGGILVGLGFIAYAFGRIRTGGLRPGMGLHLLLGTALVLVSLDPTLTNLAASAINLRGQPLGRLVALLIFCSVALWITLLHERSKREEFATRMSRLVDGIIAEEFRARQRLAEVSPIVVVIPAFNEVATLPGVLARIPRTVSGYGTRVCVVDDGSTDGTDEAAASAGAIVVRMPVNRGGGAALRVGYRVAVSAGAAVVVTMDADGQHRPEDMATLVEPILAGQADFVIGSRILGRHEATTRLRAVGVRLFSGAMSMLVGVPITDCSSGYRAFRTSSISELELVEDQFHTTETIIRLARRGVRFREVAVSFSRRLAGESKKGSDIQYGWRVARAMFKSWLRRSDTAAK